MSVSLVHVNAQVCVQIAPEDAGEYSFGGLANKTIYYDSGLIDEVCISLIQIRHGLINVG